MKMVVSPSSPHKSPATALPWTAEARCRFPRRAARCREPAPVRSKPCPQKKVPAFVRTCLEKTPSQTTKNEESWKTHRNETGRSRVAEESFQAPLSFFCPHSSVEWALSVQVTRSGREPKTRSVPRAEGSPQTLTPTLQHSPHPRPLHAFRFSTLISSSTLSKSICICHCW